MITFDRACALVEAGLDSRDAIVADAAASRTLGRALRRLREGMRAHAWRLGTGVDLARVADEYDRRTRRDGFHVLHDWDGKAQRVNEQIIPIDVLDYVADRRQDDPPDPVTLAILLDYYFMHLLALLSVRVWDDGDADENLARVDRLLAQLQGPQGSPQRFAANAATLMLIATSHYEPNEEGYDRLLRRVRTLGRPHRAAIATSHAATMGCHLRFGFEATYARDTAVMRNDNVADYPWLCFALSETMREYVRLRDAGVESDEREAVVQALLNGLSPDARAFVGLPPGSLAACEAERIGFRDLFLAHREELIAAFERYRPSERAYSPLSFFFNFSHNVVKGAVIDALLTGEPWGLTLNDLLTSTPAAPALHAMSDVEGSELERPAPSEGGGGMAREKEALATTLMAYARSSPDRIRGRLMPVIVYDPGAGRRAFGVTMRKLRE